MQSMQKIISVRTQFQEITQPIHKYVIKIENKINNFLRKLKKSRILSDDFCRKIFTSGSGPGILYGLPKIHKPNFDTNFQFRPISNLPILILLNF